MARQDEGADDGAGNGGDPRDEQLSAYLDGELEAGEEQELRAALQASPALAQRLARLARVDEELRGLAARPVPERLPERLRAGLQARIEAESAERVAETQPRSLGPRRTPQRSRRWLRPALAAAAAAVLALIVLPWLGAEGPGPTPSRVAEGVVEATDPVALPEPTRTPLEALEPSPVEIATALAIEEESDLDVIEMLDWLEELGDLEASGRG